MANKNESVTVKIAAKTAGTKDVQYLGDEISRLDGKTKRAGESTSFIGGLSKIKIAALAAAAAVGAIVSRIGDWIAAASKQEIAETKLETTLRNVTGATDDQIQSLKEQAAALQQVTTYGDEATISAQAMLGTFGLTADQIKALTPGLLDMAAAMDQSGEGTGDLTSQSIALGKALTDGIGSLKRYGVTITDAQEAQWKLADQNTKVAMLTEILAGNFSGLAEAVGNTFAGSVQKAKNAAGDAQEEFGKLFTQSSAWRGFVDTLSGYWQEIGEGVKGSGSSFEWFSDKIVRTLNAAAGAVKFFWNSIQITFKTGSMILMEAAAGVSAALASITFGDVSRTFSAQAAELQQSAAELRQDIVQDSFEARDGLESIGHAIMGTATEARKAAPDIEATHAAITSVGKESLSSADKARLLADSLKGVTKEGADSTKAIASLIEKINLTDGAQVAEIANAMRLLRDESEQASLAVEQGLVVAVSKLKPGDLNQFAAALEAAHTTGALAAEEHARINDLVLTESFKRLGMNADRELGRISPAAMAAIDSLDAIRATIDSAAVDGEQRMQALGNAITQAIGSADTLAAAEAIRERIEAMGKSGELAGQQLEQAMIAVKGHIDELTPGINSVEEALKKLGITSQATLKQMAEDTRDAYLVIRDSTAATEEKRQAWIKMAEAVIESGDPMLTAMLEIEAGALGLGEELERLAGQQKVVGDATKDTAATLRDQAEAADQARDGLDSITQGASAAADAQARLADETGRARDHMAEWLADDRSFSASTSWDNADDATKRHAAAGTFGEDVRRGYEEWKNTKHGLAGGVTQPVRTVHVVLGGQTMEVIEGDEEKLIAALERARMLG